MKLLIFILSIMYLKGFDVGTALAISGIVQVVTTFIQCIPKGIKSYKESKKAE